MFLSNEEIKELKKYIDGIYWDTDRMSRDGKYFLNKLDSFVENLEKKKKEVYVVTNNAVVDDEIIYNIAGVTTSLEEAQIELEGFKENYADQKNIVKKVESFMQYLEPLFELPQEIRKCIYTSNAVESVNSALRKVTRGKGAFPSEESVYKILYLRIKELSEKWKNPIQNWKTIQEQLIELFGERYTKYLEI